MAVISALADMERLNYMGEQRGSEQVSDFAKRERLKFLGKQLFDSGDWSVENVSKIMKENNVSPEEAKTLLETVTSFKDSATKEKAAARDETRWGWEQQDRGPALADKQNDRDFLSKQRSRLTDTTWKQEDQDRQRLVDVVRPREDESAGLTLSGQRFADSKKEDIYGLNRQKTLADIKQSNASSGASGASQQRAIAEMKREEEKYNYDKQFRDEDRDQRKRLNEANISRLTNVGGGGMNDLPKSTQAMVSFLGKQYENLADQQANSMDDDAKKQYQVEMNKIEARVQSLLGSKPEDQGQQPAQPNIDAIKAVAARRLAANQTMAPSHTQVPASASQPSRTPISLDVATTQPKSQPVVQQPASDPVKVLGDRISSLSKFSNPTGEILKALEEKGISSPVERAKLARMYVDKNRGYSAAEIAAAIRQGK